MDHVSLREEELAVIERAAATIGTTAQSLVEAFGELADASYALQGYQRLAQRPGHPRATGRLTTQPERVEYLRAQLDPVPDDQVVAVLRILHATMGRASIEWLLMVQESR